MYLFRKHRRNIWTYIYLSHANQIINKQFKKNTSELSYIMLKTKHILSNLTAPKLLSLRSCAVSSIKSN